mgnify:CR=1 FL=1
MRGTNVAAGRRASAPVRRRTPAFAPDLPDDTRLWAALQAISGGPWGGCVYDADAVTAHLRIAGLSMPVRGASVDRLEDSFDAPRDGGRRHDAVDILAPRGTPVLAAFDGTVRRLGTNALGGNVVWITDAANEFAFYYAHLDRHARGLREGMTVARGTVLGTVGTTGNAPPDVPHLHFQVLRVVDPASGTPRRWMPTRTRSLTPLLRSRISCATRVSARPISPESIITRSCT